MYGEGMGVNNKKKGGHNRTSYKHAQTSKDMATFPLGSDQSLKKAAPVTAVPIDPIPVRCIDDPWVTIITVMGYS